MTMCRAKICGGKRNKFPDLAKMLDMEEETEEGHPKTSPKTIFTKKNKKKKKIELLKNTAT